MKDFSRDKLPLGLLLGANAPGVFGVDVSTADGVVYLSFAAPVDAFLMSTDQAHNLAVSLMNASITNKENHDGN